MTIAVFLLSLLGAMAIGMPIAYALLLCGIALRQMGLARAPYSSDEAAQGNQGSSGATGASTKS